MFGQTLSPRLVDKVNILTGALPAQYGLRTAGVIDITTKSGLFAMAAPPPSMAAATTPSSRA